MLLTRSRHADGFAFLGSDFPLVIAFPLIIRKRYVRLPRGKLLDTLMMIFELAAHGRTERRARQRCAQPMKAVRTNRTSSVGVGLMRVKMLIRIACVHDALRNRWKWSLGSSNLDDVGGPAFRRMNFEGEYDWYSQLSAVCQVANSRGFHTNLGIPKLEPA
jgi:hypothetical protein